ncbi:MAG: dirigent protein, partial ['Waltheria sp.' little leaf phytoplasma]|nr:dirigent protein ['Waltheria sp.' little leaf phytoplasma]
MATMQSSIFLFLALIAIFSFSTLAMAHPSHDENDDVFVKHISPSSLGLKREKLSHLRFYFHDIQSGKNPTAVTVVQPPPSNSSNSFFGAVSVMDDPLTVEPDINSKIVGRAQGMYAAASQSEHTMLMVFNIAFTQGKY